MITGFQLLLDFSDDGSCRDIFETVMPGWSVNERKILFCALAGHHGRPPEEAARRSLGPNDASDNPHTFNLISTPWIPVIRISGRCDCTRPAELTDGIDGDPIIDLDWPRGDFRCATLEFQIGLLGAAPTQSEGAPV